MAWTGQILIAAIKFWEFKLVEEIIVALPVFRLNSKWEGSILTHLPQPIQRRGKTLNFWRLIGFEEMAEDELSMVEEVVLLSEEENSRESISGLEK